MKKLIINADDFGYSRAVNFGIMDGHRLGVLTSTTLMTNMPGAQHAAELAKASPELGVGVHLVLTCGRPLLSGHRTIVDAKGKFRNLAFYKGVFSIDMNEVYHEWKAQIEAFLSLGLKPTHLDSHHHINSFGDLPDVFLSLASEYHLPVRNNMHNTAISKLKEKQLKTTDHFSCSLETALKDEAAIEELFRHFNSVEVMTHPAYLDKEIISNSSFSYPRVDELEFLINPELVRMLKEMPGLQLCTFRNL